MRAWCRVRHGRTDPALPDVRFGSFAESAECPRHVCYFLESRITPCAAGSVPVALAAVGVHTAPMLATITVIAVVVYKWAGVAFLRRGWINLDLVWIAALVVSGAVLLIASSSRPA
jgi:hypothetical protein